MKDFIRLNINDLYLAFKYFNKARKLNCSYSYNSLGLIFFRGDIRHIKKDKNTAIKYLKKAIELGNVYAYNNLGKIYENDGDLKNAFECYSKSAEQGESWALNKIGEFYRNGTFVKKDLNKAFNFYIEASEAPVFTLCHWSKYNLAKYFYENGNVECGISKDTDKAIELLEDVSQFLMEACKELLYIYYELYLKYNDNYYLEKLNYYKTLCENHKHYNDSEKEEIDEILYTINKKSRKIKLPE